VAGSVLVMTARACNFAVSAIVIGAPRRHMDAGAFHGPHGQRLAVSLTITARDAPATGSLASGFRVGANPRYKSQQGPIPGRSERTVQYSTTKKAGAS
jgi:hypothetical protein